MPSLMTIPRELRDQICTYALFAQTNSPPALDQSFEQLIESRTVYKNPKLKSWRPLVLAATGSASPNATVLMLVNRQLRAETLKNIKLLAQSVIYELDVIILDEILPLTTWTSLPFLTTSLDRVNVTFRISGSYDPRNEARRDRPEAPYAQFGIYKGFGIGNGAGPAMTWQIYSILERFIKCGTAGDQVAKDEHQHVTVKKLNINIQTPPGIDPSRFGSPKSRRYRVPNEVQLTTLNPIHITQLIDGCIGNLLSGVGGADWFSYGKILFEHVDRVTVSQDGNEVRSFDVAQMLREVGGFKERHLSSGTLKEYKEWAWQWRKYKGLKVLEE